MRAQSIGNTDLHTPTTIYIHIKDSKRETQNEVANSRVSIQEMIRLKKLRLEASSVTWDSINWEGLQDFM